MYTYSHTGDISEGLESLSRISSPVARPPLTLSDLMARIDSGQSELFKGKSVYCSSTRPGSDTSTCDLQDQFGDWLALNNKQVNLTDFSLRWLFA